MRRWLGRLTAAGLVLLIAGLLLACWAPAFVGATVAESRWHRPPAQRAMDRPARR